MLRLLTQGGIVSTSAESQPTEKVAADIIAKHKGRKIANVRRFPTGLCHHVFDVVDEAGDCWAVRIGTPESKEYLEGSLFWFELLKPLGVPLADQHYSSLKGPIPYVVVERLPGRDLGDVYPDLSEKQKREIAGRMVEIQVKTARLPEAGGYGFAFSYEDKKLAVMKSWIDVVMSHLWNSRERIEGVGVCDPSHVDRVTEKAGRFYGHFDAVEPKAFLDDITTKNVIVDEGALSGIVDVDEVCFGDPLLTIALTNMSLISQSYETDYIDYWCEAAGVREQQLDVLRFYTALFCVAFMSEVGQKFNRDEQYPDPEGTAHLESILKDLLRKI
jgi:aminoglycoside phosphotransferase (APT) family kinase protein